VAEAYRNLISVGARPLASTDNLNFGNPEKPEIMGQFVGAIKGIGSAVAALNMPIVSGNVSLYNETDGNAILPTPTIGAVGLIAADEDPILDRARDGHVALVLGETTGHLGQSALLAEVFNREDGDAPHVDLDQESAHGEFILANRDMIRACCDLGDGGLALAAFEMAEASDVGVILDASDTATLFGEDQGRYLIACNFDQAEALMAAATQAGLIIQSVGRFVGTSVKFGGSEAELDSLSALYRDSFGEAFA
jgi:phosphoribosylformylglycinamidine synthase